ncbi:winged helix-turn-helix domain-containing protein [Halococcus saccharolyticus]|nr:helix-turn-helix domain-containing protein [Halococcus saccharolyticus]
MTHSTVDPTDALSALGNETRVAILRELADADDTLSFSDLRDRVGIRDSGKFNYHLSELCAYFVRETESGYELGHAGTRVIDAATSRDEPVPRDDSDAVDASETCPVCGTENCEKLFHVHLSPPWG